MSTEPPIVVVGAGCAGLAAAERLAAAGRRVLVLEEMDCVGGLAGGARSGRDVYEYGPHVFHTTDPEILADVKGLMGADLLPFHRTIRIKFLDSYFEFPLRVSDVVGRLPLTTVLAAAATYIWRAAQGLVYRPAVENSETVLLRNYGDVLYRLFFRDYITRVWGIPPSAFSPSFAKERIPRFNFLEFLDKAAAALRRWRRPAQARTATQGFVEKVAGDLFTTREGFHAILERMAERLRGRGAEIRLSTRVERLVREGDRVAALVVRGPGGEETIPCAGVISTMAVNETALALDPGLGPEVAAAAGALVFRAIVFVGIKVRRPKVLPASFMYFREHSFNRITDFSYFSFHIEPPGTTLLVAEVTCSPSDPVWTDDALARDWVLDDLAREKILERGEVEAVHVFRARHAHPIYAMGYERALKSILDAFGRLPNLETAGRQGLFQYVNGHVAMKMGREAADRLRARLGSAA